MPEFDVYDTVTKKTYTFKGDSDTPPTQEEIAEYVNAQPKSKEWVDVPIGQFSWQDKPMTVKVPPVVKELGQRYKDWTKNTPMGRYLAGGEEGNEPTLSGDVKLAGMAAFGITALAEVLQSPQAQVFLHRIMNKPDFQKIPKGEIFNVLRKVVSSGESLTEKEKVIWDKVGGEVTSAARAYRAGGIETTKARFGGLPTQTNVSPQTLEVTTQQTSPGLFPKQLASPQTIKAAPIEMPASVSERPQTNVPLVTKYKPDVLYNVNLDTLNGSKEVLLKGSEINNFEQTLADAKPLLGEASFVKRISEATPVIGDEPQKNLSALDSITTNLSGFAEEKSSAFSYFAKKLGTPFFIGEKYPAFKPIYTAIRDSIDYDNEAFFIGHHLLNPKFIKSLPQISRNKVTDMLKLGNMQQKVIGRAELKNLYGLNDDEIKAFTNVRRMYDFATNVNIKRRKLAGDYDTLTPEEKSVADKHIESQVKKFAGYVSQTRLGGNWAVYVPVEDVTAPNFPYYFQLHPSKAEAINDARAIGGSNSNVYLRKDLKPNIYGRMSIMDLEALADSAGVDSNSPDLQTLLKEIQTRSFASHWIKRQDIPGYKWDLDNVINSALDYLQGSTSGVARAMGRQAANKAYADGLGRMSTELKRYSADYINNYFSTGAIGMPTFQHMLYLWEIALKPSQLGQNLTQPLSTTLSSMLKYYPLAEGHAVFISSYNLASKYAMYKLDGNTHGLPLNVLKYLSKLDRQGELGEQMAKFMLDTRTFSMVGFGKISGSTMRVGEFINRSHAALVGYFIAVKKLNFTDKNVILGFVKDFISKTQFSYGPHNLPTVITGAGNIRNLLRLMYTFRHYQVSNLQRIIQMSPHRGGNWKQWTSAIGSALALHGWKGLALTGLVSLIYKKAVGRTLDTDVREAMRDADISDKVIDLAAFGIPSLGGADISQLVGMGDVIPTYGTLAENVLGAPAGEVNRLNRAIFYLQRGDKLKALEYVSPGVIRNVMKGLRYAREGVRKASGELIATPSNMDAILTGLGINPLSVSKAYSLEEAKKTETTAANDISSEYNRRLASAIFKKDRKERSKIMNEIYQHNRNVKSAEDRIKIDSTSIFNRVREMQGKQTNVPRKFQRRFKELEKVYNQ